jgi:hypothetical protein
MKNVNTIKIALKYFLFISVPLLNINYLLPHFTNDNWLINGALALLVIILFSIIYAKLEIDKWRLR